MVIVCCYILSLFLVRFYFFVVSDDVRVARVPMVLGLIYYLTIYELGKGCSFPEELTGWLYVKAARFLIF